MLRGIVGNLIADVIWAPLVWLAVREWRAYRRVLEQSHARTHEMLRAVHQQLDAMAGPDESRDRKDA